MKEQLVKKLRLAASFGIQLDKTTGIGGEAQLIIYCRFPDLEEKTIVEHYLYCIQLGVEITTHNIPQILHDFIIEEGIDWSKCKSVTTDGAKAMVGAINGVVKKIQAVSPNCIAIHCVIHREALVAKRLNETRNAKEKSDFELLLDDVKMVNYICAHAKKHRMFRELCKDMEANFTKLLLHTEVRWLSRGKVLNRVFALREQLGAFLTEEANPMAVTCQDVLWLAKLSYMASIFDHLNKLNISQQEYKDLAEQTIAIFVQMPTSHLCEQGSSSLVLVKTMKRNAILNLDPLMRVALQKPSGTSIQPNSRQRYVTGKKQESEAQSTKESEVVAITEKKDKGTDIESDAGELNISFLTVKMHALEINREIEWKKLEIEREIKE
ncbi:zinc finger MYM-type protein 6-like [Procambarus clarkii]|uniref:zinc finger MYM-type protein 6-like n=1 Tax=Procambarus clarkii TaxID=6728 RepID=UPI0037424511